ncbi:hypothetical protein HMPREF1548_03646 [Clostridium sp. KLE 1755]|nr:hypothetical protein HMPREF1548_03646 [Clostridium sp. KLE 1755]
MQPTLRREYIRKETISLFTIGYWLCGPAFRINATAQVLAQLIPDTPFICTL